MTNLTVRRLLPDNYQRMDEAIEKYSREQPWTGQVSVPGFLWQASGDRVTAGIHSILDGDVSDSWPRAGARRAKFARAHPEYPEPEKDVPLALGKHELSTGIQPVAEVTLGDLEGGAALHLVLKAKLESAVITLRNGRLTSVGSGDCEVSALLKYREYTLYDGPSMKAKMIEPLSSILGW